MTEVGLLAAFGVAFGLVIGLFTVSRAVGLPLVAALCVIPRAGATQSLPAQISDAEFWRMISTCASEVGSLPALPAAAASCRALRPLGPLQTRLGFCLIISIRRAGGCAWRRGRIY